MSEQPARATSGEQKEPSMIDQPRIDRETLRAGIESWRNEIRTFAGPDRGGRYADDYYNGIADCADKLDAILATPPADPPSGIKIPTDAGAKSGVFVLVAGELREVDHPHADLWLGVLDHPPTNECPDAECMVCGMRDCPDREPLHYHHDGCPCCSQREAADPPSGIAEEGPGEPFSWLTQADYDETVERAFQIASDVGATARGAAGAISWWLQREREQERRKHVLRSQPRRRYEG